MRGPTPYHSGSVQHEGVERSRSKRYLEAAFGGIGIGEFERALLVEGVLRHDHHRAVRIAEGDGHRVEMASGAEHLRAGPDEMREVTHHVVFRIAAHLMRVGGDGEQGVLPPAPCGILVVKNHVPVGVCGGAVAEVVVDQMEDVLRVLPAVVAGAAFGLRLDQFDLRP